MTPAHAHFSPLARLLHWTMAPLILAMLFIGVGMVATVSHAHDTLVAIHRPLGIALLVLVLIRAGVRIRRGSPALPDDIAPAQRLVARLSHLMLYVLMAAMPLIGWAMLSAAGYPVTLYGPVHLPPVMPHDERLYALLRALHTWLAASLFVIVSMHIAAALFHGLIRRDGVLSSMTGHGSQR